MDLHRRILRTGRAVDERPLRMRHGVVRDGDRLVAESGPIRMSACDGSISRRVRDRLIGTSSQQPKPDNLERMAIDRAADHAGPRAVGDLGFAPANWSKAMIAPPMSALYWLPNGPLQSDRIRS